MREPHPETGQVFIAFYQHSGQSLDYFCRLIISALIWPLKRKTATGVSLLTLFQWLQWVVSWDGRPCLFPDGQGRAIGFVRWAGPGGGQFLARAK